MTQRDYLTNENIINQLLTNNVDSHINDMTIEEDYDFVKTDADFSGQFQTMKKTT